MPIPHFKHGRSWKQSNSHKPHNPRRTSNGSGQFNKRAIKNFPIRNLLAKLPPLKFKPLVVFLLPYVFIAAGLGLLIILALFAWYSRDLPHPDRIIDRTIAQSTKIYDRTGEHLLFEVHGAQRRTVIPLGDIPEHIKWGTILIEDKKFYEHGGFDVKGIIRAVVKDVLTLSKSQGASTLTQQLVKNALLSNEKAWSRKIKEFVLAYQIERKFSKDQILQLYFNEIPYGSNAYGIESASQLYFGKSAKDLTIAEGAILASIPRAATYYSPFGSHVDALHARKNFIINLLEEDDKITKEEAEAARAEEIVFSERGNLLKAAPHFVIMVREALAAEYGEREVEQGGLKVITTLDWDMQQKAEAAVAEYVERNETQYNANNAGLVAINPASGEILAMVGSRDYFNEEFGNFNIVTQAKRQPGSSFKPFVYAVGFEKGYTDKTTLWDVVTKFGVGANGEPYVPHNYDLKERGPVSVRAALQNSLNIPAVKMLYLVGSGLVIDRAKSFGYTTFGNPDIYGLSLVLGGAEVTLMEHTGAYAVFANDGVKVERVSVLKIQDAKGKTLFEHEPKEGVRVMEEKIVRQITDVLSDNNARSATFGASNYLTISGRPSATKTGTTNDYRDAWTIGYTPQLAAGVWVGNNDFSTMKRGADGSVVAAPIWHSFMQKAHEGMEVAWFVKPEIEYPEKQVLRGDLEGGALIKIDRASGLLATEQTPETFIEEKQFRIGHNILHYVTPSDPLGPEPAENERDHMYADWEKSVQRWMLENKWKSDEGAIPTEYDNVHVFENTPIITITEPAEGATLTDDIIFFRADAAAPRGISRVEFYVDDALVSVSTSYPYVGRYVPNTAEPNGFHVLKAIAYDDIDNAAFGTINFNVLINKTAVNFNWVLPADNTSITKNNLPITVSYKPIQGDYVKIEFFIAPKNNPSAYSLLFTDTNPTAGTADRNFSWSALPENGGEYELYPILWDALNVPHRVIGRTVEVVK